jgi:hypothetical protein
MRPAQSQENAEPIRAEIKAMSQEPTPPASDATPCCANLGVEILALLRSKADARWEYYNPHFLLAITEQIEAYYKVEDDVVDDWVQEMFSA